MCIKRNRSMAIIGVCLTVGLLLGGEYRLLGYAGFFGTIGLLFITNEFKVRNDAINKIIICLIITVLIGFLFALVNEVPKTFAAGDFLRYCLVLSTAFFIYNSRLSWDNIESIINTFILSFLILLFACYTQVGFDIRLIEANTFVSTQIGADLFLAIGALLFKKQKSKVTILLIVLFLIIQYLAGSRAALLSSVICITLYWVFIILVNSRNWIFWTWVIICFLLPVAYVQILRWPFYRTIDEIFLKYTGHRFFSGRQAIWERAFEKINERLLIGQGIGFRLDTSNLYQGASEGMSVHNLFLYILLQLGIIGLLLFCVLFFRLWKRFSIKSLEQSSCMKAFLLSVLLQQTFSLGLVSGKMGFAVVCWFLLMIGAKEYSG